VHEARRSRHGEAEAFIKILHAKNQRYLGMVQVANIPDTGSALWLEWFLAGGRPDDRMFPGNDNQFRDMMKFAMRWFGIPDNTYSPGGLRAAGATSRFLTHRSVDTLMMEMRVTGRRTVLHYVQLLMGEFISATIPRVTVRKLEHLEEEVGLAFGYPPPAPMEGFFVRPAVRHRRR